MNWEEYINVNREQGSGITMSQKSTVESPHNKM